MPDPSAFCFPKCIAISNQQVSKRTARTLLQSPTSPAPSGKGALDTSSFALYISIFSHRHSLFLNHATIRGLRYAKNKILPAYRRILTI